LPTFNYAFFLQKCQPPSYIDSIKLVVPAVRDFNRTRYNPFSLSLISILCGRLDTPNKAFEPLCRTLQLGSLAIW